MHIFKSIDDLFKLSCNLIREGRLTALPTYICRNTLDDNDRVAKINDVVYKFML